MNITFQMSERVLTDHMASQDIANKHFSPGNAGQFEHAMLTVFNYDARHAALKERDTRDAILELGKRYGYIPRSIEDDSIKINMRRDHEIQALVVTATWEGGTTVETI